MKRSRFTEEQIIAILGEQEAGAATADVCRKHGISSAAEMIGDAMTTRPTMLQKPFKFGHLCQIIGASLAGEAVAAR